MRECIRVRLRVETEWNHTPAERIELIEREDWDAMDEAGRQRLCEEMAIDFRNETCLYSWELVDAETV